MQRTGLVAVAALMLPFPCSCCTSTTHCGEEPHSSFSLTPKQEELHFRSHLKSTFERVSYNSPQITQRNMNAAAKEAGFDGKMSEDITSVVENMSEGPTSSSCPVQDDDGAQYYMIGSIVDVMPRLWPGINKPGGVGRVLRVHYDDEEDCHLYDVQYIVLNGKEEKIHERFVKVHVEESGQRSVRGRCRFCGSFIRDCKHTEADIARLLESSNAPTREKNSRSTESQKKTVSKSNCDQSENHEYNYRNSLESDQSSDNSLVSDESDDSYHDNNDEVINNKVAAVGNNTDLISSESILWKTSSDAQQNAKALHRKIFETCLQGEATEDSVFINNSSRDDRSYMSPEYRQALQQLRFLPIEECMELLRLCYNFIANMSQRATGITEQRGLLERNLWQLSKENFQKDDRSNEFAESILNLDEKQEKLFRQIERAGFDVFTKVEKRTKIAMKGSVFKKPWKNQVMSISLKVSAISSSWAEELKRAREEMLNISDLFAERFGRSVEDVLDGVYDSSDDAESVSDKIVSSNAPLRKTLQAKRVRDAAFEASTKHLKMRYESEEEDHDENDRAIKQFRHRKRPKLSPNQSTETEIAPANPILEDTVDNEDSVSISSSNQSFPRKKVNRNRSDKTVSSHNSKIQRTQKPKVHRHKYFIPNSNSTRRSFNLSQNFDSFGEESIRVDSEEEMERIQTRRRETRIPGQHKTNRNARTNKSSGSCEQYDSEYEDLLDQPEFGGASISSSRKHHDKRKSFYVKLSRATNAFSNFSGDNGRIIILENSNYLNDTHNLNVPLPNNWLFPERVADQLLSSENDLCLEEVNEDPHEVDLSFGISLNTYLKQYLEQLNSLNNGFVLMDDAKANEQHQKCIDFLYNCYTFCQQTIHSNENFAEKYFSIISTRIIAHCQRCFSSVAMFREEELRLQRMCDQGKRNLVTMDYIPLFAEQVIVWQQNISSLSLLLRKAIFSDLSAIVLKPIVGNSFSEVVACIYIYQSYEIVLQEIWKCVQYNILITPEIRNIFSDKDKIDMPMFGMLNLILSFEETSKPFADKYSLSLHHFAQELLPSVVDWKFMTLNKLITYLKSSSNDQSSFLNLSKADVSLIVKKLFLELFLLWTQGVRNFLASPVLYLKLFPMLMSSQESTFLQEANEGNFELNLLLRLLSAFAKAQTEMQKLDLSSNHELYSIIHCRWWELMNVLVINTARSFDEMLLTHDGGQNNFKWQQLLWCVQPMQHPMSMNWNHNQQHSSILHMVNQTESIWSCLAFITKYQRQRLNVSRCSNNWTLVQLLNKTYLLLLSPNHNDANYKGNIMPVPWAVKLLLRNLQRLAAMALYWDSGNDALTYFLETVTLLSNKLYTIVAPSVNSKTEIVENHREKGTALVGRILATTLEKEKMEELQKQNSRDTHFGWLTLTPRSSLLIAEHLFGDIETKRASASFTWQAARFSLHRYLLMVVVLTFVTYHLPHPLATLCESLLVTSHRKASNKSYDGNSKIDIWEMFADQLDTEGILSVSHQSDLVISCIESIRTSFKLLLHNLTSSIDISTGKHSLTTSLLHRIEKFSLTSMKDKLMQLFSQKAHFASGSLLCLLVKELESCFGMNHVRSRMGLGVQLIDALIATPLEPMMYLDAQTFGTTIAVDLAFSTEDRQRSCLMFLASLLVFNPFPTPISRLAASSVSSGQSIDWLATLSADDVASLQPFTNLVTMVQTICTNCLIDHGKLTEEVEVLLLAALNTCAIVINHLDHCYLPSNHYQQQQQSHSAATIRIFPEQLFHIALQLFQSFMQLCVMDKNRLKYAQMEMVGFSVFYFAAVTRSIRNYSNRLWEEDTTYSGMREAILRENEKILTLLALPVIKQMETSWKPIIIAQLRKCREAQDVFDVMSRQASQLTVSSKKGKKKNGVSAAIATEKLQDSFLYPANLEVLQESKGYVFSTSTAKLLNPIADMLNSLAFIGWSLMSQGLSVSSAASTFTPTEFWKSWYDSIQLSLLSGEDMCVGYWLKALLWSQTADNVLEFHSKYMAETTLPLSTEESIKKKQQMNVVLNYYRQHFITYLHDLLLLLLALEAMDASKTIPVLGFSSQMFLKKLIQSLVCLDIITQTSDTAVSTHPPLNVIPRYQLHKLCVVDYQTGNFGLPPIELLTIIVLISVANNCFLGDKLDANGNAPSNDTNGFVVLEGLIAQLLILKQHGNKHTFVLPTNFLDQLVQKVYFRILQFLTICRFQANEESLKDIERGIFSIHKPLIILMSLAESKSFWQELRVSIPTIVRYFSDFVHPHVKALEEHLNDLLQQQSKNANKMNKLSLSTAILENSFEYLLPLLPYWMNLVLSVPFATQCTKWNVLLEVLLIVYHPRLTQKLPIIKSFRKQTRVNYWKDIHDLLNVTHETKSCVVQYLEQLQGKYSCNLINGINLSLLRKSAEQFVGFLCVPQCFMWFQAILSLEKSLYSSSDMHYSSERLSEPQVTEIIALIIHDSRNVVSSST